LFSSIIAMLSSSSHEMNLFCHYHFSFSWTKIWCIK